MRWFDIIAFVCKAPKVHEVKLTDSGPRLFACIYYKLYMQQIRAVMGQNVKQGVDFAIYFLLNTVFWHYKFCCFLLFHIVMPYNVILFVYLIFVSLIVLYFLHSTSVLSFYLNVILILSITALAPNAPKLQEAVKITASGPLLVFCKYYKLYILRAIPPVFGPWWIRKWSMVPIVLFISIKYDGLSLPRLPPMLLNSNKQSR